MEVYKELLYYVLGQGPIVSLLSYMLKLLFYVLVERVNPRIQARRQELYDPGREAEDHSRSAAASQPKRCGPD